MKLEVGKGGGDTGKAVELLGRPLACGVDEMDVVFIVPGNIEVELFGRGPDGDVLRVPVFVGETPGTVGPAVAPPGLLVELVEGNGGVTMVLAPGSGVIDVLLPALPVDNKDALGIPDGDRLVEDTGGAPEAGCDVDGADEEPVAGAVPGKVEPDSPADTEVALETGKGAEEIDTFGLDVEATCGVVKGGLFGLSEPVGAEAFPGVEVRVLLGSGVEKPWPPGPGIGVLEEVLTDERKLVVEFEVGNGGSD